MKWIVGMILTGLVFITSCSGNDAYKTTGADGKRYKGPYMGNRPDDQTFANNHPYVGGGYSYER